MWLSLGVGLTSATWLLVLTLQVITGHTSSSPPLNISCVTNGSINVHLTKNDRREVFVVGMGPACSDAMRHFTVDSGDHLLNTSCKANNGYILQVLDFNHNKTTGFTLTVYNVTCSNGTGSQDTITQATDVPYLEEVVLPTLHAAILPANTTLNSSMTSSSLSSMYLGQEVWLTIYNDRSQGRASYMLVPTLCETYPADDTSVRLTLLQQGTNGCTKQDAVIGQFTVAKVNDVDVAWAPLYGFKFANYPDSDLFIECTVLVCPANLSLQQGPGRCKAKGPCYNLQGYKKRRRRYVGMSRDIVHAAAGSTARTRIKLSVG